MKDRIVVEYGKPHPSDPQNRTPAIVLSRRRVNEDGEFEWEFYPNTSRVPASTLRQFANAILDTLREDGFLNEGDGI